MNIQKRIDEMMKTHSLLIKDVANQVRVHIENGCDYGLDGAIALGLSLNGAFDSHDRITRHVVLKMGSTEMTPNIYKILKDMTALLAHIELRYSLVQHDANDALRLIVDANSLFKSGDNGRENYALHSTKGSEQ